VSGVYKATFTDQLRTRVQTALGVCPTCGQPTGMATREMGARVGVAHSTLWRFLKGKKPSADLVDRLVDWLDELDSAL
jgi:hypothetical protein